MSPPSSLSKNKSSRKPARSRQLHTACLMLVSCLTYSPALKMEATWSSELYVVHWESWLTFRRNKCPSSLLKNNSKKKPAWNWLFLLSAWCCCMSCSSILKMEEASPSKHRLTFNGLHDCIAQKIAVFITNAVRTSNPANLQFYKTGSWWLHLSNVCN